MTNKTTRKDWTAIDCTGAALEQRKEYRDILQSIILPMVEEVRNRPEYAAATPAEQHAMELSYVVQRLVLLADESPAPKDINGIGDYELLSETVCGHVEDITPVFPDFLEDLEPTEVDF